MPSQDLPIYQATSSFRRQLRPRKSVFKGVLGVAPLVDVALLVLIFFMANSSFVLQPGIIVDLPEAEFVAGTAYGDMIVTVSQQGFVFFNDEKTSLEGLSSAFANAFDRSADQTLIIQADRGVSHDTVVRIYDMAQKAGIRKVALGTRSARATPNTTLGE